MKRTFRIHWLPGIPSANQAMAALCALVLLLTAAQAVRAQCVAPPTGAMVAWYTLNQISDYIPDTAAGAIASPSTPAPNRVGGGTSPISLALSFNGVNNYIEAADSIVTNFGPATPCAGGDFSSCAGNFSIEAWVSLNVRPLNPEAIVDKRGPGPVGYSFYINSNRIGLQLADQTGYENDDSIGLNWPLAPQGYIQYHHVTVTVNRTSAIQFYFDGNPAGSAFPGHTGSLVNKAPLRIGANGPDNPGGFFNGVIDEPTIYNRVLTAAEVSSIYHARTKGKCLP